VLCMQTSSTVMFISPIAFCDSSCNTVYPPARAVTTGAIYLATSLKSLYWNPKALNSWIFHFSGCGLVLLALRKGQGRFCLPRRGAGPTAVTS
jgi:hypothetical protein